MAIFDAISEGMKAALRAKQTRRLAALRQIRASFLHELKKDGSQRLADEACIPLLRRLEKQRKESIAAFEAAGRSDRAAEEREELGVVQEFLPSLANRDQTRCWVQAAIEQTGATAPNELGRVMGAVMKAHKGEVDGSLARQIAATLLGA